MSVPDRAFEREREHCLFHSLSEFGESYNFHNIIQIVSFAKKFIQFLTVVERI